MRNPLIAIRVPPATLERITREAAASERSVSGFVRLAVRRELERIEREAARPTELEASDDGD
jgi:Ribbon-helix-helix protein, copG family